MWEDLTEGLEDGFDYTVASDRGQWDDLRGEKQDEACDSEWFHNEKSVDDPRIPTSES